MNYWSKFIRTLKTLIKKKKIKENLEQYLLDDKIFARIREPLKLTIIFAIIIFLRKLIYQKKKS